MTVLIREVDATRRAVAVLRDLVDLKDGPRDEHYQAAKEAVWGRARLVLLDLDNRPGTSEGTENRG